MRLYILCAFAYGSLFIFFALKVSLYFILFFFFFQAEDGIRDVAVTGVQTCALPIFARESPTQPLRVVPRDPAILHQVRDGLVIGSDVAGEAADFGRHVGHRRTLVYRQRLDSIATVFHQLPDRAAALHVWVAQDLEHEVLRRHVVGLPAAHHDLDGLGYREPHVFRDPGVEDRRRADAEGDAAHGTRMGRVGIAPDDHHPRLGVPLEDLGVADRLGSVLAQPQLAVQPDPLLLRARALLLLELARHVEQALLHALGRHRFAEEGEVIARVISPSPAVNALKGMASPRRTLSRIEKSVVAKTPRF